ncbi:MAG: sulfotransferase [Pirellulales bacterium]
MLSLGPGVLSGITLGDWLRLLRENRFHISPRYWLRAASITRTSLGNSLLRRWEDFRYARAIRATPVPAPLFVLGIWRSGTTHLHNLLAKDDRLAAPNTYQVMYPHTFLTTEWYETALFKPFIPKTRPQDNVAFGLGEPQEDEFAIANISGLSGIMTWVFPRRAEVYDRYLTFERASADEIARWKSAMRWFIAKLAYKHRKPLVLKSPIHTCRIRMLLDLFPDAKFVHIHRNPYAVFPSACHTNRKVVPWCALQKRASDDIEERTLRQFGEVYERFFAERPLIPADRYCEVEFEQLERDPLGEMRRIYTELSLPDFAHVEPVLRRYVDGLAGYKKNTFAPLPPELLRRINALLRPCFDAWGYEMET